MATPTKSSLDILPPEVNSTNKKGGRPSIAQKLTKEILVNFPSFYESGLTIRKALFVVEYAANGFNGAQAYRKHIDSRVSEYKAGSRAAALLRQTAIQQAVADIVTSWLNEKKLRLEREIINTLYTQAFYDISLFVTPTGQPNFTDWNQIPEGLRCCIESIKTKKSGKGEASVEIKLVSRKWALNKLSQYINLVKDTEEIPIGNQTTAGESDPKMRLKTIFANAKKSISDADLVADAVIVGD